MNEMTNRQNMFCVISKKTYGEHGLHSIQTNSGWRENPYGDEYAVVPDEMVIAIIETGGYCDLTYTEDGATVASFVAREKPAPEPEPEPEAPADGDIAERVAAVETDLADLTAAVEKGLNL